MSDIPKFALAAADIYGTYLPGKAKLVEAGFEIDRGRWRCSAGLSVLLDLSATHVASLLPERTPSALVGDVIDDRRLTALIDAMRAEVQGGCRTGRLYAEGLSIALLGFLSERMPAMLAAPDTSPKSGTGQRLSATGMQRIREYVEQNLASDLSITTLSRLVSPEPLLLRACVQSHCRHIAARAVVVERRIAQAIRLLGNGHSLADIASVVGFSSQSHFNPRVSRENGCNTRTVSRFPDDDQAARIKGPPFHAGIESFLKESERSPLRRPGKLAAVCLSGSCSLHRTFLLFSNSKRSFDPLRLMRVKTH